MVEITRGINIKVLDLLRAHTDICAQQVGADSPEFVREATRDKYDEVEKILGQRERAAKAPARENGQQ